MPSRTEGSTSKNSASEGARTVTWYANYFTRDGSLFSIEQGATADPDKTAVNLGEERPNLRVKAWDQATRALIDRSPGRPTEDVLVTIIEDSRLAGLSQSIKDLIVETLSDYIEERCRYR